MAADITLSWSIKSYAEQSAKVGDTVTFTWGSGHNVFIHPTGTCDEAGAIEVGQTSGASYTFTKDDVGEVVFACDVQSHCESGQIVTYKVTEDDSNNNPDDPEPTSAATYLKSGLFAVLSASAAISFQFIFE